MAKKKLKPLSKKEHSELACHVDNEGFGYYMLHYGPDLNAIERLGFDLKKVKDAIELFRELQSKIIEGMDYED